MRVYVANFGRQNYEWPVCLKRGTVATMSGIEAQKDWEENDRERYIIGRMARDMTAAGKSPTRSTASRWFNLMSIIAETVGDIWVHRDGNDIWWTTSTSGGPYFEKKIDPILSAREVVVCHKPCEPWSNKSKTGLRLTWNGLHPKAKDFLTTEATLQSLSPSYRDYTLNLIAGDDLSAWHESSVWKEKSASSKNGYAPVKSATQAEQIAYQRASELFDIALAAERMAQTALTTSKYANGQIAERTAKRKEIEFSSAVALQDYISELMGSQEYCCELTGLPLVLDEVSGDPDMFASLDRIDSNGHYAPGNLQIVCRFANFWKGASDDAKFRSLIDKLKSSEF